MHILILKYTYYIVGQVHKYSFREAVLESQVFYLFTLKYRSIH